jgi:hypothetical protein
VVDTSPAPMKRLLILLALAAFAATPSTAQIYGGVSFSAAAPQNDFRQELGATAFGGSVNVLLHLRDVPIAIGFEGTGMTYGRARRSVPFRHDIGEVWLDVVTENNVAQGLAIIRVQPDHGVIRPYAEVVGGVNYLFTDSSVRDAYYGDRYASSTNFHDTALTGGVGAGVMVQVATAPSPPSRRTRHRRKARNDIFIDARVRYLVGQEAEYLGRGDLYSSSGRVYVSPRRSRTDMLVPQIGVTMRF